jgi:hypothetical protein
MKAKQPATALQILILFRCVLQNAAAWQIQAAGETPSEAMA